MKITAYFRKYEKDKMKGFVDLYVNGTIHIKNAKLLEGPDGLFVGMPQKLNENGFKDVITFLSKNFSEQVLEATLAARNSAEKTASIGDASGLFCTPHVTRLDNPSGSVKALASLTVRESKDAETSAFTIADIHVVEHNKHLFASMPSVPGKNPDDPYTELCAFTESNKDFYNGLIVSKAMDALGIEKKPKLDERVGEAKEKKEKAEPKAPKDSKKKEKNEERAE